MQYAKGAMAHNNKLDKKKSKLIDVVL